MQVTVIGRRGDPKHFIKFLHHGAQVQLNTKSLDGRNRAIVIADSLARVIAAIRITSVRWWSYLPPRKRGDWSFVAFCSLCCDFGSRDWRSFVQHSVHMELRNGLREFTAFAEVSAWRLASLPI